ncbi:hypothetical protein FLAT13_00014 [Flavobacterium salmonis]|uniref:Uncharacterized protein n=1 Tax=Flavobacterium salmonis TaxID=2654844 RepID=A0A6V6YLP8_9FLAO|nr:hypothetical protein FLAT13_00014 [Flavobacterium salmonis]
MFLLAVKPDFKTYLDFKMYLPDTSLDGPIHQAGTIPFMEINQDMQIEGDVRMFLQATRQDNQILREYVMYL